MGKILENTEAEMIHQKREGTMHSRRLRAGIKLGPVCALGFVE